MAHISFRNSKIVYYGPHSCENCGANIVKAGFEWGGATFNAPEGPIYPNTEWHPHICDPANVKGGEPIPCSEPQRAVPQQIKPHYL